MEGDPHPVHCVAVEAYGSMWSGTWLLGRTSAESSSPNLCNHSGSSTVLGMTDESGVIRRRHVEQQLRQQKCER